MPLRTLLPRCALVAIMIGAAAVPGPSGEASARNPVAAPGSRVALLVPSGFEPARGFTGFRNESLGASIVITELKPGSMAAVRASYAPGENPAIRRLSHTELPDVPNPGFLSVIRSVEAAKPYRKWVLAFDAPSLTGIVSINVPEDVIAPALEAEVVAALASVAVVPDAAGGGARTPPFSLGVSSRLRPVATRDGTMVVFAEEREPPGGPRLTAVAHLGVEPVVAREDFTRRMAAVVDGVGQVEVTGSRPIAAGGLDGFETSGRCVEAVGGSPCILYHAVLFAPDGYFRFVGIAATDRGAAALGEFRGLVAGFQRRS